MNEQIIGVLIMTKRKFILFFALLIAWAASATAIESNSVIVTIKPLHSLVAGVIGDTGKVELLVDGAVSPHHMQLKPSQIKSMQEAHIIFYIDDSFETFLTHIFDILPDDVLKVSMVDNAELMLLPYRKGTDWEVHDHHGNEHDAHDHHADDHDAHDHHADEHKAHDEHEAHENYDMHVWLDPKNAQKMVALIADTLSAVHPEHRDTYKANAQGLMKKIDRLNVELKTELSPIQNKPFIVFHDAYQYFEHAYGLNGVGSIIFEGSESLSPVRIKSVREKLQRTGATCVFSEPQFPARPIQTIAEGFDIKVSVLDPLGAELPNDENLYFGLLDDLAHNLTQCLMSENKD